MVCASSPLVSYPRWLLEEEHISLIVSSASRGSGAQRWGRGSPLTPGRWCRALKRRVRRRQPVGEELEDGSGLVEVAIGGVESDGAVGEEVESDGGVEEREGRPPKLEHGGGGCASSGVAVVWSNVRTRSAARWAARWDGGLHDGTMGLRSTRKSLGRTNRCHRRDGMPSILLVPHRSLRVTKHGL
jgi:hypothetical protein